MQESLLFKRSDRARHRWVICVPDRTRRNILVTVHDEGGILGVYKTPEMLRALVYWRGLTQYVVRHVKTCDLCQKCKHPNLKHEVPFASVIPEMTGDLVMTNLYGTLVLDLCMY